MDMDEIKFVLCLECKLTEEDRLAFQQEQQCSVAITGLPIVKRMFITGVSYGQTES